MTMGEIHDIMYSESMKKLKDRRRVKVTWTDGDVYEGVFGWYSSCYDNEDGFASAIVYNGDRDDENAICLGENEIESIVFLDEEDAEDEED